MVLVEPVSGQIGKENVLPPIEVNLTSREGVGLLRVALLLGPDPTALALVILTCVNS